MNEQSRINLGWQCPECYGVRISAHQTKFDVQPIGFNCQECGCQWSRSSNEWNAAVEQAARTLETANDETSRKCIVGAIRQLRR